MSAPLPIAPLREPILAALDRGPVVITSPTGSGKSTEVPRWLRARGPVVVVEPRRVACRGVAARVAELEGTELGSAVGYVVRDDVCATGDTAITFVTPGVALRWLQSGRLDRAATVLLDEFHERSMDLDLLLALLLRSDSPSLGLLSATLDGDRVAEHIGGEHLRGEGRAFPVDLRWLPGRTVLPDVRGLPERVRAALDLTSDREGDVLVFLPGKREIGLVHDALRSRAEEILPLHGGLTLAQQSRVFRQGGRRRVILATNVAETSVTLPGIEVVIDSGLVRRTRYHRGRATLTLLPIARDSAEQRRGRAGRVRPGVCVRLWAERAPLDPRTPPELHRESLVPLVLAAAACGHADLDLPFLDRPTDHAVADANDLLRGLGALDGDGITERGRALFTLPVDAHLGRLLQEARRTGAIHDAIDLVAALQVPRSLFRGRPDDPDDDLRDAGCDAVALIRALREGEPDRHQLDPHALRDARTGAARLRRLLDVPDQHVILDRRRLVDTVLAAWPGCAHVARRRRRDVAWSAGSTEQRLGRESAIDADKVDFILALDERTLGHGRDQDRIITAAMPVDKQVLLEAGLGEPRVAEAVLDSDRVVTHTEICLAGTVLTTREEVPRGPLARDALARLFLAGAWFPESLAECRDRLDRLALHARLEETEPPPELDAFVRERIATLGVESGDDVALLTGDDLLPDDLPAHVREQLDKDWPRHLDLGDARYHLLWRPRRRTLVLEKIGGRRRDPPPLRHLPGPISWRVVLRDHRGDTVLRERR